jgi:hypothetical protein
MSGKESKQIEELKRKLNCRNQYLTNEALEGFRHFKIGQEICTMKSACELMLQVKEGTVVSYRGRMIY